MVSAVKAPVARAARIAVMYSRTAFSDGLGTIDDDCTDKSAWKVRDLVPRNGRQFSRSACGSAPACGSKVGVGERAYLGLRPRLVWDAPMALGALPWAGIGRADGAEIQGSLDFARDDGGGGAGWRPERQRQTTLPGNGGG